MNPLIIQYEIWIFALTEGKAHEWHANKERFPNPKTGKNNF